MRNDHRQRLVRNGQGFTLVEVLIAILISGFILAALYTSFEAQQRSYFVNERVAGMQGNLRAALITMSREIRMAGYDPQGTAGVGILSAGPFSFQFAQDITGGLVQSPDGTFPDGTYSPKEKVTYGFSNAVDSNNDGKADNGAGDLGRATAAGGGFQAIAQNIEAIGFAYAYVDDNGQIVTGSGGFPQWAVDASNPPSGTLNLNLDVNGDGILSTADGVSGNVLTGSPISTSVAIDHIRAVRVWILARSAKPDRDFTDTTTYVVGRNVITPTGADAHYYHRLLVTTVECRNMGL